MALEAQNFVYEQFDIFNFYDQFKEYEVDFTKYIEYISISNNYSILFSNNQPLKMTLKNFFDEYKIIVTYKNIASGLFTYIIEENETIDKISFKHYKFVDYWWIILLFNNIKNPYLELPLNNNQLNTLVNLMYTNEGKYDYDTYYNVLFEQNEMKRKIILPNNNVLLEIISQYRQKLI